MLAVVKGERSGRLGRLNSLKSRFGGELLETGGRVGFSCVFEVIGLLLWLAGRLFTFSRVVALSGRLWAIVWDA